MSSKYAIALYELVQLRANMDRCIEHFALHRFRDLLGVPPGAYERGNDFIKRVIEPAVLEVNGLSEFGVKVEVERAYSRAPISGVTLAWWRRMATNTGRHIKNGSDPSWTHGTIKGFEAVSPRQPERLFAPSRQPSCRTA